MFTVTLWTDPAEGGGPSSPSRESPDLGILVPNGWVWDYDEEEYQEAIIGEVNPDTHTRFAYTGINFDDITELDGEPENFDYGDETRYTYFFGDYATFGETDATERKFKPFFQFTDDDPEDKVELADHFSAGTPTTKQQVVFTSVLAERVIRSITGKRELSVNTEMTEAIRRLRGNEAGLLLGNEQDRRQASAEQVIQGLLNSMNHTATLMARQPNYNIPYDEKIEAEYPPRPCDAILGETVAPTRYLQFAYQPGPAKSQKTSPLQLDKAFHLFMLSKPPAADAGDVRVAASTADLRLPKFVRCKYVNVLAESDEPERLEVQRITIRTKNGKQKTIQPLKKTEVQIIRPAADYLIISSEDPINANVSIEIEESIEVWNAEQISQIFEFHAASVYSGNGRFGHYVGVAAAGRNDDGSPVYKWYNDIGEGGFDGDSQIRTHTFEETKTKYTRTRGGFGFKTVVYRRKVTGTDKIDKRIDAFRSNVVIPNPINGENCGKAAKANVCFMASSFIVLASVTREMYRAIELCRIARAELPTMLTMLETLAERPQKEIAASFKEFIEKLSLPQRTVLWPCRYPEKEGDVPLSHAAFRFYFKTVETSWFQAHAIICNTPAVDAGFREVLKLSEPLESRIYDFALTGKYYVQEDVAPQRPNEIFYRYSAILALPF